jgi:hypothetical protein
MISKLILIVFQSWIISNVIQQKEQLKKFSVLHTFTNKELDTTEKDE